MPVYEYHCDSCGSAFDALVEEKDIDQAVECPLCHSHDTQQDINLYSVYGYGKPVESSCSDEESAFR